MTRGLGVAVLAAALAGIGYLVWRQVAVPVDLPTDDPATQGRRPAELERPSDASLRALAAEARPFELAPANDAADAVATAETREPVPIVGRVVDENGVGIAGADVRVYVGYERNGLAFDQIVADAREPDVLARTSTDGDGRFGLVAGRRDLLSVRATARDRRPSGTTVRTTSAPALPVVLVLGPGQGLAGTVMGDAGEPLSGAHLAIFESDGSYHPWNRSFATTDARGRFDVTVTKGARWLEAAVDAAGYAPLRFASLDASASDLRLQLTRGSSVEVQLRTYETDEPIPDGTVAMKTGAPFNHSAAGSIASAVTDRTGVARLSLQPGKIMWALVRIPGRSTFPLLEGAPVNSASDIPDPLPAEVLQGAATRFMLRVRSPIIVSGHVRTSSGDPIAGAHVLVGDESVAAKGSPAAQTDASGAFRLSYDPERSFWDFAAVDRRVEWDLTFVASGFASITRAATIDAPVRKRRAVTLDVTMSQGAVVRGRVVDPEGRPVVDARVELRSGLRPWSPDGGVSGKAPRTGADGRFVLRDVVQTPTGGGGGVRVLVARQGYVHGTSQAFVVPEEAEVDVGTIRLFRGTTLRGTVSMPDGRPAPLAALALLHLPSRADSSDSLAPQFAADEVGAFEIPAVPAGDVQLTVSAPGACKTLKSLTIDASSEVRTVSIELRPVVRITGIVLDETGRPVRGAIVATRDGIVGARGDDAWFDQRHTATGTEGTFVLEPLPPGTLFVEAVTGGHRKAIREVATGTHVELRLVTLSEEDRRRIGELDREIREIENARATDEAARERLNGFLEERKRLSGDELPAVVGGACGKGKCG